MIISDFYFSLRKKRRLYLVPITNGVGDVYYQSSYIILVFLVADAGGLTNSILLNTLPYYGSIGFCSIEVVIIRNLLDKNENLINRGNSWYSLSKAVFTCILYKDFCWYFASHLTWGTNWNCSDAWWWMSSCQYA